MDAETRDAHVKVAYAQTIKAVTRSPFHWYESAVEEILFDLDEKHDGNIEKVVDEFWILVDDPLYGYDEGGSEEDEIDPAEWMEPGVAYTMGDEGWESWEDPRTMY